MHSLTSSPSTPPGRVDAIGGGAPADPAHGSKTARAADGTISIVLITGLAGEAPPSVNESLALARTELTKAAR